MREHNWVKVDKKFTTTSWKCSNCELVVTTTSNLEELDSSRILLYFAPHFWNEKEKKEMIEEIIRFGEYNTCLSKVERFIKDIIE